MKENNKVTYLDWAVWTGLAVEVTTGLRSSDREGCRQTRN